MRIEIKNRFALSAVRLLAWRNGLEGFTSLVGIMWGVGVLSVPAYWHQPCSGRMTAWLLSPAELGWILIVTGVLGIFSMFIHWRYLRMQSSVVAFIVWGLMAVWSYQAPPIPVVDDIAVYSAFAMAELAIYVRILAGLDPAGQSRVGVVAHLERRSGEQQGDSDARDY